MSTELAILGALSRRDLHGYQLKKELDTLVGHLGVLSFGSLYPALRRLERTGAVVKVPGPTAGRTAPPTPDTGHAAADTGLTGVRTLRFGPGRPSLARTSPARRKVFRITDAGRAALAELLSDPAAVEGREFVLWLVFAGALPAPTRVALLELRRRTLDAVLAGLGQALAAGAPDRWAGLALEHEVARVRTEIDWLDGLLVTERGGLVGSSESSNPAVPLPRGAAATAHGGARP